MLDTAHGRFHHTTNLIHSDPTITCHDLFVALLAVNGTLLSHGSQNNDVKILALIGEKLGDLLAQFAVCGLVNRVVP